MAIYVLSFLTLPIYDVLIKDRKKLVTVVTLQFFLILALRDPSLGVDLVNYSTGYNYISSLGFTDMLSRLNFLSTAELVYPHEYESGYVVLNWLLGKIGISFHAFLILHAAFCMVSFGVFIYRYSKLPWLSFAMLIAFSYFEYSFGILRQLLAIAVLLWAVPMIEKKGRWWAFFLLVLLAFTFHRTAIVFAVLYLARYVKVTRIVYLANAALWGLLIALTPLIFNVFVTRILALLGKNTYAKFSFEWSNMTTLLLLFAVAAFFTLDFTSLKETRNSILCWGFLLTMPFQIFAMSNEVFGRMTLYYMILGIALIPNILADYRKNRALAEIGKYALWIFLFVFSVYQFYDSPIMPYISIF